MKKKIFASTLVPMEAGARLPLTARSGSYPIILFPTIQEQVSIAGLDDSQDKPQQGHEQNDSAMSASSKPKQGKGKTSEEEAFVPHQQKVSARGGKGQHMVYPVREEK